MVVRGWGENRESATKETRELLGVMELFYYGCSGGYMTICQNSPNSVSKYSEFYCMYCSSIILTLEEDIRGKY